MLKGLRSIAHDL